MHVRDDGCNVIGAIQMINNKLKDIFDAVFTTDDNKW